MLSQNEIFSEKKLVHGDGFGHKKCEILWLTFKALFFFSLKQRK